MRIIGMNCRDNFEHNYQAVFSSQHHSRYPDTTLSIRGQLKDQAQDKYKRYGLDDFYRSKPEDFSFENKLKGRSNHFLI